MDTKPKIEMTKELPSEEGFYYWSADSSKEVEGVHVRWMRYSYRPPRLVVGNDAVVSMGGYWAKVDQSMFEFEEKSNG